MPCTTSYLQARSPMVKKFVRDAFFYKAKKNGHLARSFYKLQEADQKFKLLKPGLRVLDLGCAPGSWIEYCLEKIGNRGYIMGIDRMEPKRAFPGVDIILEDIHNVKPEGLLAMAPPFDLILSDMAPDTTGSTSVDSYRSYELSMIALKFTGLLLKEEGNFFCKIFQGQDFKNFLDEVKARFRRVAVFKPQASKKASREVYILGMNKRSQNKP
jgi:23S rRNA (uridine2552-2'-O)-methyltransferase